MRDWDIHALFHFIRRPRMYTGSSKENDYKSIDAFLIAYEMGAKFECDFRQRLINQLALKYGVECPSEGFPEQLKIASKKANQDIKDFFINESMEILIVESDKEGRNSFVNDNRRQMIEQLESFPERINMGWVTNFVIRFRELKEWKGVNLTIEEKSKAEMLIDKLFELIKVDSTELVTETTQVNILKDELIKQLKKNVKI